MDKINEVDVLNFINKMKCRKAVRLDRIPPNLFSNKLKFLCTKTILFAKIKNQMVYNKYTLFVSSYNNNENKFRFITDLF